MLEAPATDNAWTFERHLLELAERAYLADQAGTKAAVPTNDSDKDRLKRTFNLAYRSYCARNPRWSFLMQTVELTLDPTGLRADCVDGDAGTYTLPGGVLGPPAGNWKYNDTRSPYLEIVSVDSGTIRRSRQVLGDSTGAPKYAGHDREPNGRWVLTLSPKPDAAYVIVGRFRVPAVDLSADSDVTIAGPDHDIAIHRAAVYEWAKADMRLRPNIEMYRADAEAAFADAVRLDGATKPRRFGVLKDTTSVEGSGNFRDQGAIVTQYNGTPIE